jgi:hypothetical protein
VVKSKKNDPPVGKTTLVKSISKESGHRTLWINGDEADSNDLLSHTTSTRLKTLIGNNTLFVIDEAQRITNIGLTIKLIVDNLPDVQVIVTGSSALEISGHVNEPLTGRKYEYQLFPLSFGELAEYSSEIEESRLLEHRIIFGYYPEIVNNPGNEQKLIQLISNSYLYKDLLSLEQIRKPVLLEKLLQALALQIGNEVSYNEIGQLIGADKSTVEKYIDLLEKTFVVFTLHGLNRNIRNELKKARKIYFWDNGIHNALIKNFSPLSLRQDKGALWENFLLTERIKRNHYSDTFVNKYFWRTHSQQEIDYIEESQGILNAFEFKWNTKDKLKIPKTFTEAYPNSTTQIINRANFSAFIM